jgi:hypothetical protein
MELITILKKLEKNVLDDIVNLCLNVSQTGQNIEDKGDKYGKKNY